MMNSLIAGFLTVACEQGSERKSPARHVTTPAASEAKTEPAPKSEDTSDSSGTIDIDNKKENTNVDCLWPADHSMIAITFNPDYENPKENCQALDFSSNDPEEGAAADDVGPDHEFVSSLVVKLRAEKTTSSRERVYTVGIHCQKDGATETLITKTIKVPVDLTAAQAAGSCVKPNI